MTRRNVVPIAFALLVCCALGDYATGADVTFTLLYLAPVSLAAWYRGRAFGVLLALLASASSLSASVCDSTWPSRLRVVIWNEAGVLGVLVVIALVVSRLRAAIDREKLERRNAVDQLRHADRLNVIGKLAAGVAHEIGTPLNVISGSAELLQAGRVAPEKREELLAGILKQAHRIGVIIRQLLDFGRRAATSTSRVDLNDVVRASAVMLEPLATKGSSRLEVRLCEHLLVVDANASEIEQVISNLVINGLHAMPGGGVLRVETLRRAQSSGTPWLACVVVEDEGTGIAPEHLPHIFDPFFTTKEVGGGTGLGLSVSYAIVQDHGGRIEVESELARGSRFRVCLPLAAAAGPAGPV